jgi:archaellum component FlaF (FlaF/FlaG flagellin family)
MYVNNQFIKLVLLLNFETIYYYFNNFQNRIKVGVVYNGFILFAVSILPVLFIGYYIYRKDRNKESSKIFFLENY